MQSLTPNQRRYLTVLTLLTVVSIAYLVMLIPGAASAEPRSSEPEPATTTESSEPLLQVRLGDVPVSSY